MVIGGEYFTRLPWMYCLITSQGWNINPTKVSQKPGVIRAKLIATPFQKVFMVIRWGVASGCPQLWQNYPFPSVPQFRQTVVSDVIINCQVDPPAAYRCRWIDLCVFDVGFMSTDGRYVVAVGRLIIPPRSAADAGRHIVRRRGVSHSEDNMSCRRQGH